MKEEAKITLNITKYIAKTTEVELNYKEFCKAFRLFNITEDQFNRIADKLDYTIDVDDNDPEEPEDQDGDAEDEDDYKKEMISGQTEALWHDCIVNDFEHVAKEHKINVKLPDHYYGSF